METIIVIIILAIIILAIIYSANQLNKDKSKENTDLTIYSSDYSNLELEIVKELNLYRREKRVEPVNTHDFISVVAEEHTLNCMRVGKVSHDGVGYRLAEIKKKALAKSLGEVVAYGYRDAKSVIGGFKKSASHNKVITGNYNYVGISAKTKKTKMYVTLIFARI